MSGWFTRLRRRLPGDERGQSILLLAFAATVLLGFGALVIDGGNAMLQRRQMQNAADAGALAAGRLLAKGGYTSAEILAAAQDAANKNGALTVSAHYVDGDLTIISAIESTSDSPPESTAGLEVAAEMTGTTWLARLWGQNTLTVSASAAARAGAIASLSRLFPVVLPIERLESTQIGDVIEIWNSQKITDEAGTAFPSGNRGWINFNFVYSQEDPNSRTLSNSNSASDLKDWVDNGYTAKVHSGAPASRDGDFVLGDVGLKDSVVEEARSRIGFVVYLPVYDYYYTREEASTNLDPAPMIGWANDLYFHITSFVAMTIVDVRSSGNDKWIKGQFVKQLLAGELSQASSSPDEAVVTCALAR